MKMNKMTMKLIKAGVISAAFAVMPAVQSADFAEETRDLAAFTKIHIKGGIDLDVSVDGTQKVKLEVDGVDISNITTEVKDGILYIGRENSKKRIWRDTEVEFTISMKSFDGIEVRGAVDGTITGIDSKNVDVTVSGAADLSLKGKCGTITMLIKGAGDFDAHRLQCKDAEVEIRGAGSVDIYATNSADVTLKGVGSIDVHGDPKHVKKSVKGIGSINVD